MRRPWDVVGVLIPIVFAIVWDWKVPHVDEDGNWEARSLSRVYWDLLDGPITGPVVVGFWSGLTYHFYHTPRGHR